MLLDVREAVNGQDYITAKTRLRCTFRGPAPKRTATAPPMWLLYMHGTRNELTVPGNYPLETLDAESPLLGTAPSLDAFALQSVAWARDHVGQLSDADLEALAAVDSRPGVQSAVASEVARRLEAKRGEVEAIPAPTPEPSQSEPEPVAPASEEFAPAEPDWLGIDPAEPETSSQSLPVPPPAELAEAVDRAIAATSPEPFPTAREADDIPWPPPDEVKPPSLPEQFEAAKRLPVPPEMPTPTRRVRRNSADSELSTKLAASEAENARLRGELTESAATVSELRRSLEEAGRCADELRRDYNAAAKGRAEALTDVERLTDSAEELLSQLARIGLDVTAAVKRAEVAEAEVDHLRALLAERAPMPATLSPEGKARAAEVSEALRQLADAYPWTVAADEARARLNLAGIRSPGA